MGFPPEFADMLHKFYPPWTYRYADWVAKALLQSAAWTDAVKATKTKEPMPARGKSISAGEWMAQAWEEDRQEVRSKLAAIFQWMDSKQGGPKLSKMTLDQAYEKAWLLPELTKSEKEGEVIISFEDGWRWVNLEVDYCKPEAVAMGHCASDSSGELHSLRDPKGYPHVTCTVTDEGEIVQMKGRNNSVPTQKYHPYIVRLLSDEKITGIKTEKDEDFHLSDLTEEQKEKIKEDNPNFEFSEQYSTVELLREGDEEKLRENDVFDEGSVDLGPNGAVFHLWPSEAADIYRDDDDWNSQRIAGHLLNGDPWEDQDYLREQFQEWMRYDSDELKDITTEENDLLLMKYFMIVNPSWLDKYNEENEEENTWEEIELDTVWDDLIRDEKIIDAFEEAWVEMRQESTTKAALRATLAAPIDQNIVDGFEITENHRIKMKMTYDRLADLVDMHHPGTPMGGSDVITMLREIEESLVKLDPESDFYGYEEDDHEEFNSTLMFSLKRLIKQASPQS